jgi:hypothetical protein
MIIEHCIQGSPEWHALRLGVATASNFGKILTDGSGKTRKTYMRKLRDEILTGRKEQTHWSAAMERGVDLEPLARKAYEDKTNQAVDEIGFIFKCDKRRIGGSPDGLIGFDGGLEIKCPLPSTHEKYLRTQKIPNAYRAQIQGCLWLTGRNWWDFISYCPEFPEQYRMITIRFARDDSFIGAMTARINHFIDELDDIVAEQRSYMGRARA